MVLHMVGAVPIKEGTGRIARYELLPLEALGGRPRVDVLCNMSGIFRLVDMESACLGSVCVGRGLPGRRQKWDDAHHPY
jgi:cobalamin biosynthesis Mg chelatase CobN